MTPPPGVSIARPQGLLSITVIDCFELLAADSNGKSDPYAMIEIAGQVPRKTTTQVSRSGLSFPPNGPNYLALWLNQLPFTPNGRDHLGVRSRSRR